MVNLTRYLLLVSCMCHAFSSCEGKVQSRKKRWLVFPKGSSLQLVYCWLLSTFGTRDGIFVINITVGLAWEIPQDWHGLLTTQAKSTLESRHRRQLYSKIGLLLDRQGVDGTSCIKRAICESYRAPSSERKFIHSLLQGLFTLPELDEDHDEIEDHMKYKSAESKYDNCEQLFPCDVDVLHFK